MLHAIPNSGAMTAAEIRDWLTAPRRDCKPTEEATWSVAGIAREFGVAVEEAIYGTMIAAGLHGMAARFASLGLDTGDPQWASYVDSLAEQNRSLSHLVPRLRDLGYDTRPMWERLGLTEPPTIETIEAWKEDAAKVYTHRQVLLSANTNPDGMGIVVRIMACDAAGRTNPGSEQLPGSLVLRPGQATGAAKALYDAVQTAITKYVETL